MATTFNFSLQKMKKYVTPSKHEEAESEFCVKGRIIRSTSTAQMEKVWRERKQIK